HAHPPTPLQLRATMDAHGRTRPVNSFADAQSTQPSSSSVCSKQSHHLKFPGVIPGAVSVEPVHRDLSHVNSDRTDGVAERGADDRRRPEDTQPATISAESGLTYSLQQSSLRSHESQTGMGLMSRITAGTPQPNESGLAHSLPTHIRSTRLKSPEIFRGLGDPVHWVTARVNPIHMEYGTGIDGKTWAATEEAEQDAAAASDPAAERNVLDTA
ncbi:hypothetical protein THAOC_37705, partial [Thalassiosira oceanica]